MKALKGHQFKVVITGNGSVGKTTLLNRYFTGYFDRNIVPTIGVNAKSEFLPLQHREKDDQSGIISMPDESEEKSAELFQYWDLGGQHMFDQIRPVYFAGANGVMLCFNMNDKESLFIEENNKKANETTTEERSISRFINDLAKTLGSEMKTVPVLLVGTKNDLEHNIKLDGIRKLANIFRERNVNIISHLYDSVNGLQVYGFWSRGGDEYLWDRGDPFLITSSKKGLNCDAAFRIMQLALKMQRQASTDSFFER